MNDTTKKNLNKKPKAPLIRSLGYIFSGILFFAIFIYILLMSSYNSVTDILCVIVVSVFAIIIGILLLIVGYRRRRW